MSTKTMRLNLSSSEFPLLNQDYGRSVIMPQNDTNYVRPNAFSGSEADRNIGIPQLLFAENVMPVYFGYKSIGYTSPILQGGFSDADHAFYLTAAGGAKTLFVPAAGQCRLYNANTASWSSQPKAVAPGAVPSCAFLKERQFVCFSNHTEFYEWDGTNLDPVVLTGLAPANIRGLVAGSSYLVAWDYNTVYWSAIGDPTDFVPSSITGAGSISVLANKGRIEYCTPINDGFVIYTNENIIYAFYSSNPRYPFTFREVKGSSGISNFKNVTSDMEANYTYVYTTNGVQKLDSSKAQIVFPEVTEFLSGFVLEAYNWETREIQTIELVELPEVRTAFVGQRWLVISYGQTIPYEFALVYDTSLQRWGKLRVPHVDVFEFIGNAGTPGSSQALAWDDIVGEWDLQNNTWAAYGGVIIGGQGGTTVPYKTIGFLQATGEVKVANFARNAASTAQGVMHIGKIQFIRERFTTLQELIFDGSAPDMGCRVLSSINGSTTSRVQEPFLFRESAQHKHYKLRVPAENHTVEITNTFALSSFVAKISLDGKR